MADWAKIEAEYITTETSYRKLAQKYGLNQATIAQKAKAEDWVGKRKQQASTAQALILEKDINKKVDRATRLKTVADKLLDKVEALVSDDGYLTAASIKNLSDALKNIKEAQMIRTDEDILEQKARIAKLQKEAEKQDNEKSSITITLEGSLSDYAQ
jgi:hypothetical protein